jgi:hypothetical protein
MPEMIPHHTARAQTEQFEDKNNIAECPANMVAGKKKLDVPHIVSPHIHAKVDLISTSTGSMIIKPRPDVNTADIEDSVLSTTCTGLKNVFTGCINSVLLKQPCMELHPYRTIFRLLMSVLQTVVWL